MLLVGSWAVEIAFCRVGEPKKLGGHSEGWVHCVQGFVLIRLTHEVGPLRIMRFNLGWRIVMIRGSEIMPRDFCSTMTSTFYRLSIYQIYRNANILLFLFVAIRRVWAARHRRRMPVEQPASGARRSRGLADIAPQYVAKVSYFKIFTSLYIR